MITEGLASSAYYSWYVGKLLWIILDNGSSF